jgi:sulfhydrogenase subunit beta (sulfur reductase)
MAANATTAVVKREALEALIPALQRRGYQVIGPAIRDSAIVFDKVDTLEDLPVGWTSDHDAGCYRLRRRSDQALFGYVIGPRSPKKFFHPSEIRLQEAARENGAFNVLNEAPPNGARYAFLGVRPCDLAAISRQDRVLLGDQYVDNHYQERRAGAFLIAVNCTEPASTCFCTSMGTGPAAKSGFDLLLTEIIEAERHIFLVEAGSDEGEQVLAELEHSDAVTAAGRKAQKLTAAAAAAITRKVDTAGIRDLLYENFEHPEWERVAARCMACANCTMVCPTCFCVTVEDTSDVKVQRAERWRKWDSCFTQSFSYIHGGAVRLSVKSRYRQWLTHKFAAWIDQFGSSGCVGCGRCITWCPVGIDVTQELAAIRGMAAQAVQPAMSPAGEAVLPGANEGEIDAA